MIPVLIGTKIGMTQVLGGRGEASPVTVVKAGPCVVLQVKSEETDGYHAVQLGFGQRKPHRSSLAMIGHAARAGTGPKRVVREFRLDGPATVERGDVVTVQNLADAEIGFVDVTGITKGRGFTGVMKRHGFGGMESSHGVERKHRSAGSIGGDAPGATGRGIKKGKRMAGRSGHVRRTARALRVVKVDAENDLLLVGGSIPGPNGSTVLVRPSRRRG